MHLHAMIGAKNRVLPLMKLAQQQPPSLKNIKIKTFESTIFKIIEQVTLEFKFNTFTDSKCENDHVSRDKCKILKVFVN